MGWSCYLQSSLCLPTSALFFKSQAYRQLLQDQLDFRTRSRFVQTAFDNDKIISMSLPIFNIKVHRDAIFGCWALLSQLLPSPYRVSKDLLLWLAGRPGPFRCVVNKSQSTRSEKRSFFSVLIYDDDDNNTRMAFGKWFNCFRFSFFFR